VKVGDLVQWNFDGTQKDPGAHVGIVVDGPREVNWKDEPAISYEVVWFDAKETFWHHDDNLELISENR
jgi:hypothetical protein